MVTSCVNWANIGLGYRASSEGGGIGGGSEDLGSSDQGSHSTELRESDHRRFLAEEMSSSPSVSTNEHPGVSLDDGGYNAALTHEGMRRFILRRYGPIERFSWRSIAWKTRRTGWDRPKGRIRARSRGSLMAGTNHPNFE
jgi:hypothetical protein